MTARTTSATTETERRRAARSMLRGIDAMAARAERLRPYLQEQQRRRYEAEGRRPAVEHS